MRKATRVTLAAGVLALALVLGVTRPWSQGRQEPLSPESTSRALRPGTGLLLPAPAPRPEGSLRIRGVVLRDGGPLRGVRVTATRAEAGQTLSELSCAQLLEQPTRHERLTDCWFHVSKPLLELIHSRQGEAFVYAETATGEDGTFTLEALPEGELTLWAADARGAVMWPEVPAGTEGLTLVLGEGLALEGTALGEDGAPLSGVRVTALSLEHTRFFDTETGADGRYRLGPLPSAEYLLAVDKEGWLPLLQAAEPSSDETLRLYRPRRVTGRVLSGGVPVAGAEVYAIESAPSRNVARTDPQGRFVLDALEPGPCKLAASRDGRHAVVSVDLQEPVPPPEVVLELGSALHLEGTVRDTEGQPLKDVDLSLESLDGLTTWARTTTDTSGRYRVGPLPFGTYDFSLASPRYQVEGDSQRKLGPDTGPVDFTMAPAPNLLEGQALDEEGRPASHVFLELLLPASKDPKAELEARHGAVAYLQTDEEGRFVESVAEPGPFRLVVGETSGFLREPMDVVVPGSGVRLMLRRGASVSGTVTDERGAAVRGASVTLWPADEAGDSVASTPTDARGRFTLSGLPPGRFMVEARAKDGAVDRFVARPVELEATEAAEVSLRLEAGWTLSGLVVDGAGQPLRGVRIVPSTSEDTEPPWRKGITVVTLCGSPPHARTGPDGRFTLRNLQVRELDLKAEKDGYRFVPARSTGGQPVLARLHVREGEGDVRLVLERRGHVRGRLVGPGGEPITRFFSPDVGDVADPQGAFAIPIKATGPWTVRLFAKGMAPVRLPVEAREGVDVDVGEVRMGPGRPVRGRVLDAATSAPVKGVWVMASATRPAEKDVGSPDPVHTNANGEFVLPHVEARPLTLYVEARDYLPQALALGEGAQEDVTVRLAAGAEVTLNVLDAQGKRVGSQVYVEREGAPMSPKSLENLLGSHVLRNLEPGSYVAHAYARPSRATVFDSQRFQVPASGRVSVTLKERVTGTTLVLRVKGPAIGPALVTGSEPMPRSGGLSQLKVRAFDHDLESQQRGTVTYRNLPPGRFTLFLMEDKWQGFHREELDLPASGTVVHEVTPRWEPYDGYD